LSIADDSLQSQESNFDSIDSNARAIRSLNQWCQHVTQCRNCKTQFDGAYCSNCGQKDVDLERPTIKLIGEVLKETFDVDGRAFRTIRALIRRLGLLTSEFLVGRHAGLTLRQFVCTC